MKSQKVQKIINLVAGQILPDVKLLRRPKKVKKLLRLAINGLQNEKLRQRMLDSFEECYADLQRQLKTDGEDHDVQTTKISMRTDGEDCDVQTTEISKLTEEIINTDHDTILRPQLPKPKFAYNLYCKKGRTVKQEAIQVLEEPSQAAVYCTYLLCVLPHTESDEQISEVLAKCKVSEGGEKHVWLSHVTQLCDCLHGSSDPNGLRLVMEMFNLKFAETAAETTKSKGLEKLITRGQHFIKLFHSLHRAQAKEFAGVPQYEDFLAGILATYIDLCLSLYHCKPETCPVSGKDLCSLVLHLMGKKRNYVYDILLQLENVKSADAPILLPLASQVLETIPKVETCVEYLKYVLSACYMSHWIPDGTDSIKQKASSIAAPSDFIAWIQKQNADILDEMPVTKRFRGIAITRFLLDEANDEMTQLLMDMLSEFSATEVQGELTSADDNVGDLFVIDKAPNAKTARQIQKQLGQFDYAKIVDIDIDAKSDTKVDVNGDMSSDVRSGEGDIVPDVVECLSAELIDVDSDSEKEVELDSDEYSVSDEEQNKQDDIVLEILTDKEASKLDIIQKTELALGRIAEISSNEQVKGDTEDVGVAIEEVVVSEEEEGLRLYMDPTESEGIDSDMGVVVAAGRLEPIPPAAVGLDEVDAVAASSGDEGSKRSDLDLDDVMVEIVDKDVEIAETRALSDVDYVGNQVEMETAVVSDDENGEAARGDLIDVEMISDDDVIPMAETDGSKDKDAVFFIDYGSQNIIDVDEAEKINASPQKVKKLGSPKKLSKKVLENNEDLSLIITDSDSPGHSFLPLKKRKTKQLSSDIDESVSSPSKKLRSSQAPSKKSSRAIDKQDEESWNESGVSHRLCSERDSERNYLLDGSMLSPSSLEAAMSATSGISDVDVLSVDSPTRSTRKQANTPSTKESIVGFDNSPGAGRRSTASLPRQPCTESPPRKKSQIKDLPSNNVEDSCTTTDTSDADTMTPSSVAFSSPTKSSSELLSHNSKSLLTPTRNSKELFSPTPSSREKVKESTRAKSKRGDKAAAVEAESDLHLDVSSISLMKSLGPRCSPRKGSIKDASCATPRVISESTSTECQRLQSPMTLRHKVLMVRSPQPNSAPTPHTNRSRAKTNTTKSPRAEQNSPGRSSENPEASVAMTDPQFSSASPLPKERHCSPLKSSGNREEQSATLKSSQKSSTKGASPHNPVSKDGRLRTPKKSNKSTSPGKIASQVFYHREGSGTESSPSTSRRSTRNTPIKPDSEATEGKQTAEGTPARRRLTASGADLARTLKEAQQEESKLLEKTSALQPSETVTSVVESDLGTTSKKTQRKAATKALELMTKSKAPSMAGTRIRHDSGRSVTSNRDEGELPHSQG